MKQSSIRNIKTHIPRNSKYKQGCFDEKFQVMKYYGARPIIYRSSLEYKYMINLERNPDVIKWTSEGLVIPYVIPEKIDGKTVNKKHRYLTDFVVHHKNGKIYIVEIKPYSLSPKTRRDLLNPDIRKNAYKWQAAINWCKLHENYEFKVITDQDIK